MSGHAECGAVHEPDAGTIQQIQHEILVTGDDASIRTPRSDEFRTRRKDIEGSLRLVADDSIDRVEAVDNHVASFLERRDVPGNEILRAGESLQSGSLTDRRR